jgi:hypothetical protein
MFTRLRITTPAPIFAPKILNVATFSAEGTGNQGANNKLRTTHHSASFQAGAPRVKGELLYFDRSITYLILNVECTKIDSLALHLLSALQAVN